MKTVIWAAETADKVREPAIAAVQVVGEVAHFVLPAMKALPTGLETARATLSFAATAGRTATAMARGVVLAVHTVQMLRGVCAEIAATPRPQVLVPVGRGVLGLKWVPISGEKPKQKQGQAKKRCPGCFKCDVADGSMYQEQQQEQEQQQQHEEQQHEQNEQQLLQDQQQKETPCMGVIEK